MIGKFSQFQTVSGNPPEEPSVFSISCVVISLLIHLAVLGALVFSPFGQPRAVRISSPKAIEVDLVGLNPELPLPAGAQKSSNEPAEPVEAELPEEPRAPESPSAPEKPEARPIPVKTGVKKKAAADYEVVKPAPAVKTSLKKKTFDARKVIEGAVRRLSEESSAQRPRSLQDRIAEMEKQVSSRGPRGGVSDRSSDSAGAGTSSDFGPMEVYQAEVAVRMRRNWAFSSELAGGATGLETRLVIKILPDGSVTDVWYEKRSGNAYLDESAYKTVMKANPLPALPQGYSHYHLVLGFTPSGLRQ